MNTEARKAIRSFCGLLPTTVGTVTEEVREEGFAFTIANPELSDRPIEAFTDNEELTLCFAASHYHIADYGRGRTEAELVEDMILGIAAIVGGSSRSYAVYSGDRTLGGGFTDGSDAFRSGDLWRRADRFQIYSWDGSGDKEIRPSMVDEPESPTEEI
ncbi:hypothetical protein [Haloferula sp. BvORR071]|uniref:hypothetical protein n=1 Tax=Haloferula sp. BvORR071 TaxID=1396141 RepID=UPI0022410289|nr:hypothetical protein [Haloferula sp. BvORR071]